MPRPIKHIPGHSSHAVRRPCVVSTAFLCPPLFFFFFFYFFPRSSFTRLNELPFEWTFYQRVDFSSSLTRRTTAMLPDRGWSTSAGSLAALAEPVGSASPTDLVSWRFSAGKPTLFGSQIYIYIFIDKSCELYAELYNILSLKWGTAVSWLCWLNLEMYCICIILKSTRLNGIS